MSAWGYAILGLTWLQIATIHDEMHDESSAILCAAVAFAFFLTAYTIMPAAKDEDEDNR